MKVFEKAKSVVKKLLAVVLLPVVFPLAFLALVVSTKEIAEFDDWDY